MSPQCNSREKDATYFVSLSFKLHVLKSLYWVVGLHDYEEFWLWNFKKFPKFKYQRDQRPINDFYSFSLSNSFDKFFRFKNISKLAAVYLSKKRDRFSFFFINLSFNGPKHLTKSYFFGLSRIWRCPPFPFFIKEDFKKKKKKITLSKISFQNN